MGRSANAQRLVPSMPPLLQEEKTAQYARSTYSGTACENIVKSYFLTNSINIAEPYVDDGVDLLIHKPEGWVRGQVKKVVYQNKLDYKHKKNYGKIIYRDRFSFNFQGGGRSVSNPNRKQRTPKEIDYFYHVLLTPYRQLIWETPASIIPLRKDGTFIHTKNPVIDRDNWIRMKADINFKKYLIYSKYDAIIFKQYPDFFLNEKITLNEFFT